MVATSVNGMTLEDYKRLFDEEGAFEFIEGQITFMPQKTSGDNYRANMLALAINNWAAPQNRGIAFVETPFVVPDAENQGWIKGARIPDVMFIRQELLNDYAQHNPEWDENPFALIPDLVVEFISPSDKYLDVSKKIQTYLRDGVRLVWLINAELKTVTIYMPNSEQHSILSVERNLKGGDVLPDFEIPVKEIFNKKLVQWQIKS